MKYSRPEFLKKEKIGSIIGGEWHYRDEQAREIRNPYDETAVAKVHFSSEEEVEKAIAAAKASFQTTRKLPAYERAEILMQVSKELERRKEEAAAIIALEAGKPIKDALVEADRAINTFRISSEEARRIEGEYTELDSMPAGRDRFAVIKRFPIGPIAAISPFNFPLNLVAHKLGPAIASGNPIVLKPASKTPLSALFLGELILKANWPKEALSIIPCSRETGEKLVTDPRFKMLTFTGSPAVGWPMKQRAGPKKKVVLELGGNAGVIIDRDANLKLAAQRVRAGGFGFAGQSCISVQRVYVHKEIEREFTDILIKEVKSIKIGDPLDESTDLGPMIDDKAAKRTEEWVREAVEKGGEILTGGKAKGRIFEPTVLRNVRREAKICSEEAFAPVLVIETFASFEEALEKVNDSAYGLQAGVFTNSHKNVWKAFEELEVGGVIINDVPTFRVDQMPYGGVKESGVGREGPRYAIEDMTEMKIMVLRRDI